MPSAASRNAFTLIELLVVIGIILLVAAITLSAVNLSISGDRIRGAARQTQSYLEGARSRAVYGGKLIGSDYLCGVRFIRESANSSDPGYYLVSSMQYVELHPSSSAITDGEFSIDDDGMGNFILMNGTSGTGPNATRWYERLRLGLIYDGQTVVIDGRYKYQVNVSQLGPMSERLVLSASYQNAVPMGTYPYKLLLPPQPMPNQEPRSLGNGVVIDLKVLSLPQYGMSKGLDYFLSSGQNIDIMYNPRGTVTGRLSGTGIVEFVLSDREDALKSIGLTEVSKRERLIVSLKPQTGMTAVHPVYVGTPADPYRYAETGEVARQ